VGLGLAAVHRERRATDQARQRAEANLELARKAVDECFVLATEEPLLQQEHMRKVRKLLLEKALPYYEGFRAQRPDDPELQEEQADNLFRVAVITSAIGLKTDALDRYRDALEVQRRLAEMHPESAEYQGSLARTYNNMGALQSRIGQPEAALVSLEQAQRIHEQLAQTREPTSEQRRELAQTFNNLGALQRDMNRPRQARASFDKARQLLAPLAAKPGNASHFGADLAGTLYNLGLLQKEAGQAAEARRSLGQARQQMEQLARAHPELRDYRSFLARIYNILGVLDSDEGDPAEALKAHARARQIRERLADAHPEVAGYQSDLAETLNNLGRLHTRMDQPALARSCYQQAHGIFQQLSLAHREETYYRLQRAGAARNLGEACEPQESLRWFDEAIEVFEGVLHEEPRHPEAREGLRKAHWRKAEALDRLGRARSAVREWEAARALASGREKEWFRLRRTSALARAGHYERALVEVKTFPGSWLKEEELYEMACIHAVCAAGLGRDPARPLPERQKRAEELARRAMQFLHQARQVGYLNDPANVDHLKADNDLVFLRDRSDFKALVAELEKKKP
jgi:tetratricopeptide (TPR) repeat protein